MTVIELKFDIKSKFDRIEFEIENYGLYYFKTTKEEIYNKENNKKEERFITKRTKIDSLFGDGGSLNEVLMSERAVGLCMHMDSDIIEGSISFKAVWGVIDGYIDETPMDYPVFIIPIIYKFKDMYLYHNDRVFVLRQKKVEKRRVREILSEPSCIQWESVPSVVSSFVTLIKHFCRPEFITIKRVQAPELSESETEGDIITERGILTEFEEIIRELMNEINSNTFQPLHPFLTSTEKVLKHFLAMIDIQRRTLDIRKTLINYDLEFENFQKILNNFTDILNNIIAALWLVSYSLSTFMFGEYSMSVVLLQKSLEGSSKSFGRLVLFLIKPNVSSKEIGETFKNAEFFKNKDDYKSFEKLEKLVELCNFFGIIEPQLLDGLKKMTKEARNLYSKIETLRKLRNKLVHFPDEKWLKPILLRTEDGRVLTVEEIIKNLDPLFGLLLDLVELAFQFLKEKVIQEVDEYEEVEIVVSELESVISELRMFMPNIVASKLRFLKELYLNILLLSLLDFEEVKMEVIR